MGEKRRDYRKSPGQKERRQRAFVLREIGVRWFYMGRGVVWLVRGMMTFHFFVRTLHAQRGDGEGAAAFRPRRDPQDTVRGYFLQFIRPQLKTGVGRNSRGEMPNERP